MQQHTEPRSAKAGSKLTVTTLAFLEQPPPAALTRRLVPSQRSLVVKRQALLQESILEKAPSQTSADGTSILIGLFVFLRSLHLMSTADLASAGGSSFSQALFNSVNIMLGVGMLSIPYALKEVSLHSQSVRTTWKSLCPGVLA